jgi:hypothetical protein
MIPSPLDGVRRLLCLAAAALACTAQPAAAQTARPLHVSAGYVYVSDPSVDVTFTRGWSVSGSKNVNDWLGLVATYDDSRKTIPTVAGDLRLGMRAWLAGPQVSAKLGRATEFGQVLVGLVRATGGAFGVDEAGDYTGVQAGAGIDYPIFPKVAFRLELDYRTFLNRSSNLGHQIRALAGVTYTLK